VLGKSKEPGASPTRKGSVLRSSVAFSASLKKEDDRPTILIYSNDIAERQEWTGALGRWQSGNGGWTQHVDRNGERYYFHTQTNTTQWDRGKKLDQAEGFGKPAEFGNVRQVMSYRIRGSANVQDVRMQMDKNDEDCLKVALLLVNINASTKPSEFAKLMDIVSSVTTYLPVMVVIPEDVDDNEAVECIKAGASGYLKRPFPIKLLCDRVALLLGRYENIGRYYTNVCATREQMKMQRIGGKKKDEKNVEEKDEKEEGESLDTVDGSSTIDSALTKLDFEIDDSTETLKIEKIRRKQMYNIADRTSKDHCTSSGIDLNVLGSLLHLVKDQAKARKELKPSVGHNPPSAWRGAGLKQKSDTVSAALSKLEHKNDDGRRLRKVGKKVWSRSTNATADADSSENAGSLSSRSLAKTPPSVTRRINALQKIELGSKVSKLAQAKKGGSSSSSSDREHQLLTLKANLPGVDLARTKLREPAPSKTHASRCDNFLKVCLISAKHPPLRAYISFPGRWAWI
jgi:DNA-binding NarL/FixJ family response regulator